MNFPYKIFPLGDSALTIDFGNKVDEQINTEVITRHHQLKEDTIPGIIELIPAYSSLTIYYDLIALRKIIPATQSAFEWLKEQIQKKLEQPVEIKEKEEKLIRIPVCYENEFATDLQWLCEQKNLSRDELINIHTSTTYKIYMLGFLPGFAYMGEVEERIATPRKDQPVNMIAGSVGIAGKQTGIYPLESPGGWQIIGRTPLKIFDAAKNPPVLFRAGDKVQFYAISKKEFLTALPSYRQNI